MKKTLLFMSLMATGLMFAQPGTLDMSFGTNGYSVFGPAGTLGDGISSIAIQPDGKIVCAGTAIYALTPDETRFIVITRYNMDGSPDNTFATTITPVGLKNNAWIEDIALQNDGKIVVTGTCLNPDTGIFTHNDVFILRCNSNGGLDNTFGDGGTFIHNIGMSGSPTINTNDNAHSVAVQQDGKIIIVGQAPYINSFSMPFALRVTATGALDSSFGTNGLAILDFSEFYPDVNLIQFATGVAVQGDGKIVLAGKTGQWYTDLFLARLNTNGTLDSGFGTGGKVVIEGPFLDNVNFLMQPDGKFLLSAKGTDNEGALHHKIVRRSIDGSPDNTFGTNGSVNISISPNIHMGNIALQADGKIVAIDNGNLNMQTTLLLSRLNTDGSHDTGFGTDGHSTFEFSESEYCIPYDLSVQEDGKIVAGLTFRYANSAPYKMGVMRFYGGEIMNVAEQATESFSIYPNPATNALNIQNQNNIAMDGLTVTDITGKTVRQQTGNTSQIDVQNLSPGIYFLKVSSEGKEHQHKFIKQ